MTELASEDSGVRRPLLLRRMFEVLLASPAPLPAREVMRRVEQREPFTERERSASSSGSPRVANFFHFASGWAKAVGWLDKSSAGWILTPEGRAKITGAGRSEDLHAELTQRYRQVQRDRRAAGPAGSDKVAVLTRALDLVEAGQWTAYSDLAELTGLANQNVGSFAAGTDHENGHRVLHADGQISASFRWTDDRTDDPREVLEAEGIEFDERGRASQAQRLTAHDLRAMLAEIDGEERERRAWMVRGSNVNGHNLVPAWLAKGSVSIPASQLRALPLPVTRPELVAIVDEDYSQKSYTTRTEKVSEIDTFVNRMRTGDLVVTSSGPNLHLGTVTGDAVAVRSDDDRSNLRRTVEWRDVDAPIDFASLPKSVAAKLSSQHTVIDLTSDLASLNALVDPVSPGPGPEPPPLQTHLPDASDDLAADLLVDQSWLQMCVDLLEDRKQLIYYGPPGTGKTFIAQRLAQHLTDPEAVKLVQFHPAYNYEDFFEGFRPTATSDGTGAVGFQLTPGPFRRLVDAARESPGTAYVLIIDEINRANLAKVFGELYFLLEYRDSAIDLLYSSGDDQSFTMPENVYIIGTMNTADRSIALVDAAMRRRFAFVPLHPSDPPTSGVLSQWLEREGLPQDTARLLDTLNSLIEDEDFKIGPSYFMRPSVHSDGGLELMWRTAILPLLEEHHYGEDVDVRRRYDLDRLLRASGSSGSAEDALLASDLDATTSTEEASEPRIQGFEHD